MVATLPAPLTSETCFTLPHLRWSTFQALISELASERDRHFLYTGDRLHITEPGDLDCLILQPLSWSTLQALLADVGGARPWRIAYANNILEIRMPRAEHEEPKRILEDLVTLLVDELELEVRSLGSLTLAQPDLSRAVEPDSCFYIQNEARVRGKNIQLPNDPPPDLVIESDYTHSSLNKHTIYAALGVPEIWRYRRQSLEVYHRVAEAYQPAPQSLAFPQLDIATVPHLIQQSQILGQRQALREFRRQFRARL
ncbi:MAG: Uma2 family endonuclease [Spirulina sp. SIO3F2]|nr:Uma2 family endonuclease [Spirulina sp. SIO3F2]